jgi:AraC-like DNA-binding protein
LTLKASGIAPAQPIDEATVWESVKSDWRQLYGGFHDLGVSIEWHEFQTDRDFEWSRSFHPESVELCLNVAGGASMECGKSRVAIEPLTATFYFPGDPALVAWRLANQEHRFITIEFSRSFLRCVLSSCDGAVHPLIEAFVAGEQPSLRLGEVHRLSAAQEQLALLLARPSVFQAARGLWYQGKVLEVIAEFFFERKGNDELFCDRQKRLARDRVDGVIGALSQNLSSPPDLERIGQLVGCSPFHLSRTFSKEMGMTIPQYLRKLRMERAAELLRSGRFNVTQAAMSVGYSSLSHFSQAFCQTMGCCPGLFHLQPSGFPKSESR